MKIELRDNKNGYVILTEGVPKDNGEYVFKATEEFKMIEFIGLNVLGKKIKVEEA